MNSNGPEIRVGQKWRGYLGSIFQIAALNDGYVEWICLSGPTGAGSGGITGRHKWVSSLHMQLIEDAPDTTTKRPAIDPWTAHLEREREIGLMMLDGDQGKYGVKKRPTCATPEPMRSGLGNGIVGIWGRK